MGQAGAPQTHRRSKFLAESSAIKWAIPWSVAAAKSSNAKRQPLNHPVNRYRESRGSILELLSDSDTFCAKVQFPKTTFATKHLAQIATHHGTHLHFQTPRASSTYPIASIEPSFCRIQSFTNHVADRFKMTSTIGIPIKLLNEAQVRLLCLPSPPPPKPS